MIFRSEVEANLISTHSLLSSYDRIASTSTSESSPAVLEARDELRGTLSLLEADLEDLEESVRVVEETGERWGIEVGEVQRRRGFVERVKGEVRVGGRVVCDELKPVSSWTGLRGTGSRKGILQERKGEREIS